MINIIYIIKNIITDKIYVGQTWQTLEERWKYGHGYKDCTHLNNAINKYGKENFFYEILTFCSTQETADYLEDCFIEKYHSDDPKYGYNIRKGGSRGRHSEKTKRKMSESAKGKIMSNVARVNMSKAHIGKSPSNKGIKMSDSSRQKMSEAKKGKPGNNLGKQHTDESKRKISEAGKGRVPWNKGVRMSDFSRQKMSKSAKGNKKCIGYKHTEEAKKNMSESHKGKTWKLIDGKRIYGKKAA